MKKVIITTSLVIVASAMLAGCNNNNQTTQQVEQATTDANQRRLMVATPAPNLSQSLERENLVRRLELLNTENMTGCITLVSYGTVMGQYVVDGKVTSLNSYLTADQQYVDIPGDNTTERYPIEMADLDGAYGQNTDGVFFFTPEGVYVEWKGDYIFSDQCLPLSVQPVLTMDVTQPTTTPTP